MNTKGRNILDVLELTKQLIRFPSEELNSKEIQEYLAQLLTSLGFSCTALPFVNLKDRTTHNLFAIRGSGSPHFVFGSHTDVVKPGKWPGKFKPYKPVVDEGYLYGRGAEDMKGGLAASIVATARFLEMHPDFPGTLSFMITGDEEGDGDNGMPRVVEWVDGQGIKPDFCIIAEPSGKKTVGDTLKIGSRGCMDAKISILGIQGHTALPDKYVNPLSLMIAVLHQIDARNFGEKAGGRFEPTNLNVVSWSPTNEQHNQVPGEANAVVNIRFSDAQSRTGLTKWIEGLLIATGAKYTLNTSCFNEPYLSELDTFISTAQGAVEGMTGLRPELTTRGGASDARVISKLCPTVEMGPVVDTSHKVNERTSIKDLYQLTDLYVAVLDHFFNI